MKYLLAVLMLLICFLNINTGEVRAEDMGIRSGSKVAFDYTLTVDGQIADSSKTRGPLEYTQGDGKLIPGLTKQMEGMKAGDEKIITVKPEEGYGNPNPAAIKEVPSSTMPKGMELKAGMILQGNDKSGRTFPVRIIEIKKDTVVIDLNHPLAGKTLVFNVKIVSVK